MRSPPHFARPNLTWVADLALHRGFCSGFTFANGPEGRAGQVAGRNSGESSKRTTSLCPRDPTPHLSERLLRSPGVPVGSPGRPIRPSSLVPSSVSQNLWLRCHRPIPVTPGLSGTPLRRRSRRNTCGRGQVVRSVPLGAHAPRQPIRRPGRGWGRFRAPTPSVWRHHPLSSPGGSPRTSRSPTRRAPLARGGFLREALVRDDLEPPPRSPGQLAPRRLAPTSSRNAGPRDLRIHDRGTVAASCAPNSFRGGTESLYMPTRRG